MWRSAACSRKIAPFSWRFLTVIIAGCLLVLAPGLLAGCSSAQTSYGNKTVITEMDYWPNEPSNSAVNKLFQRYQQLHPNVVIQRDAVPFSSLLSKADQEAASHTLPDLLMLDNPDLASFASAGVLAPMDSYMQGNYSKADFYAGPLSTMQYGGKVYGFSVGNNDLALFYNKKMFTDAHLTPPTTWNELYQDAKALTHGSTYGFAFSATSTEESTWQFEPFLWSNGGDLTNLGSPQSLQALQFITSLVRQGYASQAALNWGQGDVEQQFVEGHAAIMENGPWNIPLLNQAKVDYGVVPFPVNMAGQQPTSPLGGEMWTIPTTNTRAQQASWDLVNWLEQPQQLLQFDKAVGYIPEIKSTAQTLLKSQPGLKVFADEFQTARSRTAEVGPQYPAVSLTLQTAIQSALSNSNSPQDALSIARQHIVSVMKG
ncbi:MAG TPA: sugar ABC transporter substrate-binding protein [Ktedonobacteraceae bacterium]|nr:sugar ABC transporter substrate-binding protein [Ktedonobacteraceae bacterium]